MGAAEVKGGRPRGTRPDAETDNKAILIKRVSGLRATYQIRLLAFLALQRGMTLVIEVPKECVIHKSLSDLIVQLPAVIRIERA